MKTEMNNGKWEAVVATTKISPTMPLYAVRNRSDSQLLAIFNDRGEFSFMVYDKETAETIAMCLNASEDASKRYWMTDDGEYQGVTIKEYLSEWADVGDTTQIRHAIELPPTWAVVTTGMHDYREFATKEEAEEFAKELLK